MKKLKFVTVFVLSWATFAALFYGITQLSFLLKPHTDFGKLINLWTLQIFAPFAAIFFASISSISAKKSE